MRDSYKGFYQPSKEEFKKLWEEGLFIFDANVFLNFYRFPESVRNEFIEVMKKLSDRIWIPFHVGLEFQRTRLPEISRQKTRFSDVKNIINKIPVDAKRELDKLQLKKRHSKINPDDFLKSINNSVLEFENTLNQLELEQSSITEKDNVRELIDELFNGRVGSPPSNQEELDNIKKEGEVRYNSSTPPGYKDVNKGSESFSHGGLVYLNQLGDLIIWKQIINHAKDNSLKNIVFVTDDSKEDWWWTSKEGAKKTIGPRPELVEEISREAGTENFYIYNSERFLKFSAKYLDTKVSDESINQVRDITKISDRRKKFIESNISGWRDLIERMFDGSVPSSYEWRDINDIVSILDTLGQYGNVSHVFMPNKGGLDISGAKVSAEEGCIEMEFDGSSKIVKPSTLMLETFDRNYNWAYFRLDTETLLPSGVVDIDPTSEAEVLIQLEPGKYGPYDFWNQGYLDYDEEGYEIPLPSTARPVTRNLSGSFVIFSKGSIYNQNTSTYDARHNTINARQFKEYIEKSINEFKKTKKYDD